VASPWVSPPAVVAEVGDLRRFANARPEVRQQKLVMPSRLRKKGLPI